MNTSRTKEAVVSNFNKLMEDAKAHLAGTADQAGEKAEEARKKLNDVLETAQDMYADLDVKVRDQAQTVDHFVQDHPYQFLAGTFVFGLMLGWLTSRK